MFHLLEDRLSLFELERMQQSDSFIDLQPDLRLTRILKFNLPEGRGRCN